MAGLRAEPGIEWVEVDIREAWLESGRVRTRDIWLDDLDHYVWYAEIDRRPGSLHQVLLRQLARTVRVHPDPWRWAVAVDKLTAHEALRAAGLPVPEARLVGPGHLGAALDALEAWGALLLKPRRGAWGEGTLLIDHPATLRDVLGYLRSRAPEAVAEGVFLERYHDNDPDRWTSVTVLGGRPTIGYRKRPDKRVPLPGGRSKVYDADQRGGSVDGVPLTPALRDLATAASRALGCPFIGFDVIATPAGPVIVDENTSPGTYPALYREAGLDAAACFADAIVRAVRGTDGA